MLGVALVPVKWPDYNLCLSLTAVVYADANRPASTERYRRGTCSTMLATFSPIKLKQGHEASPLKNFLSNLLAGGNLKNMPVAKGACYHWSVRPAPVLLALSGVAYYCSCSALFCLLEAWISCSLWILDTLMDMISEWKLCCFHIQHYFDHMNLPTPPYVFQTCHCLCMMGSLVTDVFCIGSWKRNV
jgi:hypothetical protein